MLIDFHAHIFPDKIAERAVAKLTEGTLRIEGRYLPPRGEATLSGILREMDKQVSLSLIMPIATSPTQTDNILSFAERINARHEDGLRSLLEGRSGDLKEPLLLSFASLHPDENDVVGRLEDIAERGFLGIKLHPEFQDFYIDSKKSLTILQKAEELGLLTVIHAGRDIGMPPPVHATPEAISHVLGYIEGGHLIAAHLGGFRMWDDVEKHLVGKPLYFDTAYLGTDDGEPDDAQYLRIIRAHGPRKVLFGSDYPWKSAGEALSFLKRLGGAGEPPLSREELDLITCGNALRLLSSKR